MLGVARGLLRAGAPAPPWLRGTSVRTLVSTPAHFSRARNARVPLRHRLSDVTSTPTKPSGRRADTPAAAAHAAPERGDEHSRPGELPPLLFESPAATQVSRSAAFTSPPLSSGLLHMVHQLLGPRATPTTPQAQALAHFANPRHARTTLLAAETGSGKTLAYLLPTLQMLHESRATNEYADVQRVRGGADARILPRAVILAPTHELARQIAEVAKVLCHDMSHKLRVACSSKPAYISALRADLDRLRAWAEGDAPLQGAPVSPDVLVTTPAFLNEYGGRVIELAHTEVAVVDEADTLLDDGFRAATESVLQQLSFHDAERVFVTATIPRSMRRYLDETYTDMAVLASPHLHHLPARLKAMFVDPGGNKDMAVLKQIFRIFTAPDMHDDQILIFRDKRDGVERLAEYLRARNVDVVALTGEAEDRKTRTSKDLAAFLAGPSSYFTQHHMAKHADKDAPRVLITTSLLSRGLDFGPRVRHVLLPDAGRATARSVHAANNNALELLHRAGRSARAGRAGTVVVFDKNSAPNKAKVLINLRGQKKGVVRGQMDLLVSALKRKKPQRPRKLAADKR